MTAAYRLTSGSSIVRTADSATIPAVSDNRDYVGYLAWVALGNTADAAPVLTLSAYKAAAIELVEGAAEGRRQVLAPRMAARAMLDSIRYAEAILCVADGSPNGTKYPILGAEATAKSITIAAAGTAAKSELDTLKTALAAIETVKYNAGVAINAAGSNAAVDTAVAAIVWP